MAFGGGFINDDFVNIGEDKSESGSSEFMSSEFLEHCFFIFDEAGQDESCPPEEILVFFYPEKGLEMDKKLFLQGSISAMIVYASQFQPGENVKTLSLTKAKFSIKKVGDFTIVVTGRIDEGDGVLQRHVEALYQAYRFYWGGLDHVAERFKNKPRREFLDCIKEQCRTLLPLLHGFRKRGRLNPFLWLPFSSPPPNTSRHFMQASNILSALELNEYNHAGCIFYESSVLCTHMDVEITRWVLNRIELSRIDVGEALKRKMRNVGSYSVTNEELPNLFTPIFLTNDQLEKLGVNFLEGDEVNEDDLLNETSYILNPPSDGRYLTLCIVCNAHITLAVIMSLSKLHDHRHAGKIRLEVENRLTKLEQDINSVYKRGSANNPSMRDSQNLDDKLTTYHFLTTDSLTGMTKGNILNIPQSSYTERDDRFLQGAGFIHELYESSEISKVMLAGHCGLLYSRHMFSKEIFYQRSISAINVDNITLEKLEENAQHVLAEQQNIQLI